MRYNNPELAHVWANTFLDWDESISSFNGNFSARGDFCNSYSTQIARKYPTDKTLLLDRSDYSCTTQRHKSYLRSAFSHWNIIEVDHDYLNRPEGEIANSLDYLKRMLAHDDWYPKLKNGIFRKEEHRRRFIEYVCTLITLTNIQLNAKVFIPEDRKEEYKSYKEFATAIRKFEQQRMDNVVRNREKREKEIQAKIDQAVAELREHLTNEKKLSWNNFVKTARTAIHGDGYRQHYYSLNFYNLLRGFFNLENKPPYECYWAFIWREGSKVKTSKGVTVDWREVEMLLKRWKAGKPVLGLKAGIYTITHIDQEVVKIGCHNIPIANLEALYKEEIA